jgi:hypothetical protein
MFKGFCQVLASVARLLISFVLILERVSALSSVISLFSIVCIVNGALKLR